MVIIFGLIRVIGIFLFLYLLWRKLRTDYKEDELLSYSWLFLLTFLISGRIVYGLAHWGVWNDSIWDWLSVFTKSGFDYIGGYLGGVALTFIFAQEKGWKLWNFAEDITSILMVFFLVLLTGETIMARFNLELLLWLAVLVLTVVLTNMVAKKYRSFVWYASGRKGFLFLFANLVFGLGGFLVSWWLGNNWAIRSLYLVWGLISAGGLVMLGEMLDGLKINKR